MRRGPDHIGGLTAAGLLAAPGPGSAVELGGWGNCAARGTPRQAWPQILDRRGLPQLSENPEEYRTYQYAGDQLTRQSGAKEDIAYPSEYRQANHRDRNRDPERVQMLANTTAMIQPIGHSGTGRS